MLSGRGALTIDLVSNELTEITKKLWSDFIGVPISEIGDDANFFRLGGYSLAALEICAKLQHQTNVVIPPHMLLVKPDLNEFVEEIRLLKAECAACWESGEI